MEPATRSYLFHNDKLQFEGTYTQISKLVKTAKIEYYVYTTFTNSKFTPDWEDKIGNIIKEQEVPAIYRTLVLMLGV